MKQVRAFLTWLLNLGRRKPEEMLLVAGALRAKNIELLEEEYHWEIFGTWWIVARKSGTQAKLVWNGKDALLHYETKVEAENTKKSKEDDKKWGDRTLWKTVDVEKSRPKDRGDVARVVEKFCGLLDGNSVQAAEKGNAPGGVHAVANGEIGVWINEGGAISLQIYNEHHDPAELAEHEAEELGGLLLRLGKQLRERN